MKNNLALILILLAADCAYAQTAVEIQTKYGKSVDVYSVSEHVWMTPEYASDGQVCRMRLYPKRISANTNYGANSLPFNELRDVLNALVRVETRGPKKKSFGATATGGGAAWTTYDYENVSFTFISFFPTRSYEGVILKRGEYVFPKRENEAPSTESNASSDDFVEWVSKQTEIVMVSWEGRKCAIQ
ncbi:MAG TPA: hypothetical protein VGQ41_25725 [Pyrinomonadaceae bacterium]|nr:hypothetical protein [Pyrinomonadaceae bacterium]